MARESMSAGDLASRYIRTARGSERNLNSTSLDWDLNGSVPSLLLAVLYLPLWLLLFICAAALASAQTKPDKDYLVYVLSESADRIALVRFGPDGARVDHDLHTGEMPTDLNGPHGIAISPDKKFYYVSLAHGRPFGTRSGRHDVHHHSGGKV